MLSFYCNSQGSSKGGFSKDSIEVIDLEYSFYDSPGSTFKNPVFPMTQKIWRKGSFVIEECKRKIVTAGTIGEQYQTIYRLNDLKNMMAYTFLNFADTATIQKRYSLKDTTIPSRGGWGFGYIPSFAKVIGEPIKLPDTVIENESYKRYRVTQIRNDAAIQFYSDCFTKCERKGTLFDLNRNIGAITIKCPIVKVYTFSPNDDITPSSGMVTLLSNTLTADEKRVFSAWESKIK